MTTDDLPPTDAWALHRADEASVEDTDGPWVLAGRLVLGDDDVVACAAGAVRASARGQGFAMWLITLDEQCWSTGVLVQVTELTDEPRPGEAVVVLTTMCRVLEQLHPLGSLIIALASPSGGDRSRREVRWADALADAARTGALPVRGIVSVGAHRARLLHSAVPR